MACLLLIETATSVCSAAISESSVILAESVNFDGFKHAENLMPMILQALEKSKRNLKQLDAIAVSAGPGSYTGLRIGVSTAKGLCYSLGIPLIGISTLEILSNGFRKENPDFKGLLCPMIDARRMEVYTALFENDGKRRINDEPMIVETGAFAELLENHQIAFFGDGAEKCKDLISNSSNAHFGFNTQLFAANMELPASVKFERKEFEDLAYFEPEYLKPYAGTPPKNQFKF